MGGGGVVCIHMKEKPSWYVDLFYCYEAITSEHWDFQLSGHSYLSHYISFFLKSLQKWYKKGPKIVLKIKKVLNYQFSRTALN